MKSRDYAKQTGFTLIELMFVVVIISVLLTIGIPSYRVLKNNNCLTTNTNKLVAALSYARSEAAKRNTTASLSPLDGAWRNGFSILTNERDLDNDGDCDSANENIDASTTTTCDDDVTLKIIEFSCGDVDVNSGLQVNKVDNSDADETTNLVYRSNGRVEQTSRRRTFKICMSNFTGAERGRQVTVSNVGRPSTKRVDTNNCPFAKVDA